MADAAVLILGGCGFVGRHLVALLVQKGVGKVRIVDKLMPSMANLSADHKAAFAAPAVEFKQADLSRQTGVDKAFDGCSFTHVFNLTFDAVKFGENDEVYQQLVVDVATRCGAAAAQRGVARFVDLSTAQVYEPNEKGSAEKGAKLKPWTKQATYKLRAEAILRDVPGLNLVVLRAATMYGPGDVYGLSPRLICAAVYKHLGEKMKFAWDGKLRANTVSQARPPAVQLRRLLLPSAVLTRLLRFALLARLSAGARARRGGRLLARGDARVAGRRVQPVRHERLVAGDARGRAGADLQHPDGLRRQRRVDGDEGARSETRRRGL